MIGLLVGFAAIACWWCRKPLPPGYQKSRSDTDFPTAPGDVPADEHDFDDEHAPVLQSNVKSGGLGGARRSAPGGGVLGAIGRAVGVSNADTGRGDYVAMEPIARDDDLEVGHFVNSNSSTPGKTANSSGVTSGAMKLGAMRLGNHKDNSNKENNSQTDPLLKRNGAAKLGTDNTTAATTTTSSAASTPASKKLSPRNSEDFEDDGDWGWK